MRHLIILALVVIACEAAGQDFRQAIGVNIGTASGVSYKMFLDHEKAIESALTFKRGGTQFTLLRQYHAPVFMNYTTQLFFLYGYGGHLGYYKWSGRTYTINGQDYLKKAFSIGFGVDVVVGFEYHFLNMPLAAGIEYKPYYEIKFPKDFKQNITTTSISLKYTF